MPRIQVSVNQNRIEINPEQIESAASRILNALGYTDAELSISVVDDGEMREINRQYRGQDRPTDVLSFAMLEGEFGDVCPEMLGDIVISAETARAEGIESGASLDSVMDLLLVHGILHLLGFDHEQGSEASRRMKEKTQELLRMLGRDPDRLEWFFD